MNLTMMIASDQLGGGLDFLTQSTPSYQFPTFTSSGTSSGGTSLSLSNIFNTGASLASQIIASLGKRETTQIANVGGKVTTVQPAQTPYGSAGQISAAQQQANAQTQALQTGGVGAQAVGVGAGLFDGIAQSFGISTSTLMLLGIGGFALYMMKSPRK